MTAEPAAQRRRQLALLSAAELMALSLWFSASAVLPALTREWQLGDAGRAGLTNSVQLGFIVGTLISALGNLPDVLSPRRLMVISAILGAVANGAIAIWVDSPSPAFVLRFFTGVALAQCSGSGLSPGPGGGGPHRVACGRRAVSLPHRALRHTHGGCRLP